MPKPNEGMTYVRPEQLVVGCRCPKCEFWFEQNLQPSKQIEAAQKAMEDIVRQTADKRLIAVRAELAEVMDVSAASDKDRAARLITVLGILREHGVWRP